MKSNLPEWVEKVKQEYALGASDEEVCKEIGITKNRFNSMYEDANNEGFRKLIDMGRMMSKAYWYGLARKNLWEKSFNYPLWYAVMKNRFGWAEKSENYERSDVPAEQQSLDELQAKLNKMLPGILKQLSPEMKDSDLLNVRPN